MGFLNPIIFRTPDWCPLDLQHNQADAARGGQAEDGAAVLRVPPEPVPANLPLQVIRVVENDEKHVRRLGLDDPSHRGFDVGRAGQGSPCG
jgi:hypothetical protein